MKTDIENSLIMGHIKKVICDNNFEVFNYFMAFLDNLLQHPQQTANTVLTNYKKYSRYRKGYYIKLIWKRFSLILKHTEEKENQGIPVHFKFR